MSDELALDDAPVRQTVTVRDEAGNLSRLDVPFEHEVYPFKFWQEHLASGRYVIVDEDPETADADSESEGAADAGPGEDNDVPSGSIDDVVAWIRQEPDPDAIAPDGWPERARAALDVEQAKSNPRKGLVELLTDTLAKLAD